MSETQKPDAIELPSEDSVLAYTQHKRQQIANQLLADGKLPEDPKMAKLALDVLDGMDRAALGRKRIKVEEQANKNQEHAAGLIAEILHKVSSNRHPSLTIDVNVEPPRLSDDIPAPELVDGETSPIGSGNETYETFTARMYPQTQD